MPYASQVPKDDLPFATSITVTSSVLAPRKAADANDYDLLFHHMTV